LHQIFSHYVVIYGAIFFRRLNPILIEVNKD